MRAVPSLGGFTDGGLAGERPWARTAGETRATAAKRYRADDAVSELLQAHLSPPMAGNIPSDDIAIWVSGHTHGPSMSRLARPDGRDLVIANTGCWLEQLRPVEARFGAPTVFVPVFVQTHVLVRALDGRLHVELWEDPRRVERRLRWIDPFRLVPKGPKPADRRLPWLERLMIAGRMPEDPPESSPPRIVSREVLKGSETNGLD